MLLNPIFGITLTYELEEHKHRYDDMSFFILLVSAINLPGLKSRIASKGTDDSKYIFP